MAGHERFILDFVGIGAARSGTTWISKCLEEHPNICMPDKKELHFFNTDHVYKTGVSGLRKHFPKTITQEIVGEFTPRYIISKSALLRIKDMFSHAKIIVLLRNPVDRAFSQFIYFKHNKQKESSATFEKALEGVFKEDYIQKSSYTKALNEVFSIFGRQKVHIIFFDDISDKPEQVVKKLYAFLDVDVSFIPSVLQRKVNSSVQKKVPTRLYSSYVRCLHWCNGAISRYRLDFARPVFKAIQRVPDVLLGAYNKYSHKPVVRDEVLSKRVRKKVFVRYFKKDVEQLETLLKRDLSSWKP